MNIIDYGFASDAPSRTFRLRVNGQAVKVIETPPMTAVERQQLCDAYRKLPSYCHIYDPACMHLHAAHFSTGAEVSIAIETDEEIASFRIHPLRRAIAGRASGRQLSFTVPAGAPRYLIVRINALPPLMLAIDAPEKNPPAIDHDNVIDAGLFLTDAGGAIDQTENFQRAFAAADGSGKTLRVPPGVYSVTQLHLKSARKFELYLSPGCLLKIKASEHGENQHRHGIWLEDCEDVSITGRGCIDHQAYEHYVLGGNNYQHGMVDYYTPTELCPWITQSPLFITGSRRITVDGLTIRNGRNFNLNCRNCDDLTLRAIKILTPPACTPEYADGINTGSCHRVLIEDCLVACNDDCFATGHYFSSYDRRSSQEHMIRGMVGWNMRASAVRLGFYAGYDQGDFTFERCDFSAMIYTSLLIHALRSKPDGQPARFGTIRVSDCTFDDTARLDAMLSVEKAAIEALIFENVTYHGDPREHALWNVEGDPIHPIGKFLVDHVVVNEVPVTALSQIKIKLGGVTEVIVK